MYVYMVISAFITGFLAVILYYISEFTKKTYWHTLPGPKGNFLFGNGLDFYDVGTHQFLQVLQGYIANYGKLVRVRSTLERGIIVTDRHFTEFILSSNKIIDKSNDYKYYHNWLGTGLLTSTGAKWKQRRKIITPAFHFSILEQFVSIFEKNGQLLVGKLSQEVDKSSVNIYPYITLCSLDIICETGMGTSVNAQLNEHSDYVKNVKFMCNVGVQRAFSVLSDIFYPLTPLFYQERRALKVVHAFTNSVIDSRRKTLEKSNNLEERSVNKDSYGTKPKLAFLDLLLRSTVEGRPLSKEEVREEVDTFMFEGHDTTASAITFTLYLLSKHQAVQQKVYDEQKALFENLEKPTVTYKDLNEMKYLEMVIKESIRLYPSVPFIGRQVMEEFEYEGSIVPKELTVILYLYGILRDPDYFPNPEEFIPERFESPNDISNYSYIPFSAGPRNCIGQKFAMLEMKSTVSKIIRHFHLQPSTPQHEVMLAAETVLISKNGVHVSLKKRAHS